MPTRRPSGACRDGARPLHFPSPTADTCRWRRRGTPTARTCSSAAGSTCSMRPCSRTRCRRSCGGGSSSSRSASRAATARAAALAARRRRQRDPDPARERRSASRGVGGVEDDRRGRGGRRPRAGSPEERGSSVARLPRLVRALARDERARRATALRHPGRGRRGHRRAVRPLEGRAGRDAGGALHRGVG